MLYVRALVAALFVCMLLPVAYQTAFALLHAVGSAILSLSPNPSSTRLFVPEWQRLSRFAAYPVTVYKKNHIAVHIDIAWLSLHRQGAVFFGR